MLLDNYSQRKLWNCIFNPPVLAVLNHTKVSLLISVSSLAAGEQISVMARCIFSWNESLHAPDTYSIRCETHLVPAPDWTTCWCSASCGSHPSGSEPSCGPGPHQSNRPMSERPAMMQQNTTPRRETKVMGKSKHPWGHEGDAGRWAAYEDK